MVKKITSTGQPTGASTAQPEGHSHDYSGGIHQKSKTLRAGYQAANAKSANGQDVVTPPPGTPQVPDRSKAFAAYSDKPQPKSPREYPDR